MESNLFVNMIKIEKVFQICLASPRSIWVWMKEGAKEREIDSGILEYISIQTSKSNKNCSEIHKNTLSGKWG